MTRWRAVAGGALVTVAACVVAWALAYPAAALAVAAARALADGAAVVTLGLAVVPALDGPRYRDALVRRAAGPLVVASATWVVAELARLILAAAETAGSTVTGLELHQFWPFLSATAPGRAGLLTVGAAAVVCAVAATARRSDVALVVSAGSACIGVVGHPLTGHLAGSPVGGVAVAAHTVAAAVWCGVLAALVLTVDHRGQWARVLPRFSALSTVCVSVLLVGGIAAGATVLDAPAALYDTGYGRVLSAKIAVTVLLIALGWRNRAFWLPAARSHRSTAAVSRTRAYTELALMAAALAAAATLSVTG